jgi:hypothetical protein
MQLFKLILEVIHYQARLGHEMLPPSALHVHLAKHQPLKLFLDPVKFVER